MTNTITILAIILVGFGMSSAYACSEENVEHWTLIAFSIQSEIEHDVLPDLEPNPNPDSSGGNHGTTGFNGFVTNNVFDIKVLQNGLEVPDLREKVASTLMIRGYFNGTDIGEPLDPSGIFIMDIDYSIICVDGIMGVVGGMLLQPDATAMFLAYGIANAIWLAPLAGIGAGVYLTRNKWKK